MYVFRRARYKFVAIHALAPRHTDKIYKFGENVLNGRELHCKSYEKGFSESGPGHSQRHIGGPCWNNTNLLHKKEIFTPSLEPCVFFLLLLLLAFLGKELRTFRQHFRPGPCPVPTCRSKTRGEKIESWWNIFLPLRNEATTYNSCHNVWPNSFTSLGREDLCKKVTNRL